MYYKAQCEVRARASYAMRVEVLAPRETCVTASATLGALDAHMDCAGRLFICRALLATVRVT
jgi:hypothetical protein